MTSEQFFFSVDSIYLKDWSPIQIQINFNSKINYQKTLKRDQNFDLQKATSKIIQFHRLCVPFNENVCVL